VLFGYAEPAGTWANIPPKRNRTAPISFSPCLYKDRNLVERFFNRIKRFRRVAARYDKLATNYLAFVELACIRLWLRVHESTAYAAWMAGAFISTPSSLRTTPRTAARLSIVGLPLLESMR